MGAIVTSLLYISISLGLVGLVGRALSRGGRAFLDETFGAGSGAAEAASRLLVVAFYLLSLGFVALTLPSWAHVTSTGRALQLLSGRLGVLLLVLGALHVTSTAVIARLRRGRSRRIPYFADPAAAGAGQPGPGEPGTGYQDAGYPGEDDGGTDPHSTVQAAGPSRRPGAGPAASAVWRSRPPRVVH